MICGPRNSDCHTQVASIKVGGTVELTDIPKAGWDRLNGTGGPPMSAHLWSKTAAEIYARDTGTKTLQVGPASAPSAIASFYRPRINSSALRLLGALDLGESVDPIANCKSAYLMLAQEIWHLNVPVDFGHLPTDTPMLNALIQQRPAAGVLLTEKKTVAASPVLHLDATWSDPAVAIGRKRRQLINRKRRQAEAHFGPVKMRVHAPDPTEALALIKQAYEVEARSWKSRVGTALAQQPQQSEFFLTYGVRAAERGILRIALLSFGDHLAAMHYGVEIDGVFWSLRVGYDERFAEHSPGLLLLYDLICDCVAKGLARFEFCGKEAEWTRRWTNKSRPIAAVRLYPPSLNGYSGLARDVSTLGWRKMHAKFSNAVSPKIRSRS